MQSDSSETRPDGHLQHLAMLPVSFLTEQDDRFSGLCDQSAIAESYRDILFSGIWAYCLYSYRVLVREKLGIEIAEAVWLCQRELIDEFDTGAGQSMESAFGLIDAALTLPEFSPGESEVAINVPPESRVALALLLAMPGSPDYARGKEERSARVRTMQADVEDCLARCLLRARTELLAACSNLFEQNSTDI